MTFTAAQRSELRDAVARSRVEALDESRRLAEQHASLARAERKVARVARVERATRKKAAAKPKRRPVVIEPLRSLTPVSAAAEMEVELTRNDLTDVEREVFDRLYAVCETEWSTVDVVTHVALVAKTVCAGRAVAGAA